MTDEPEDDSFLRRQLREAGERYQRMRDSGDGQFADAKEAYRAAKNASQLPTDEDDRVKIVCRRHVEKRARALDEEYRPSCYEAGHPDCEGCVEDIHEGRIETW